MGVNLRVLMHFTVEPKHLVQTYSICQHVNLCYSSSESGLAVVHMPNCPDVAVGLVSLEHLLLQQLGGGRELLPPAGECQKLGSRDRRPQRSRAEILQLKCK